MKIRQVDILSLKRPFLIAEAATAHLGNMERAYKLTEIGIAAGADALTFQQIDEKMLYTTLPTLPVPPQDIVSWECLEKCRKLVHEANLAFSVCVTDIPSLKIALTIGIDFIKIVSYDITYFPFLQFCASTKLPILMSTGASTFEEVTRAVNCMKEAADRLLLYHTDCGYPTATEEINLLRMLSLRERFQVPIGYCDHTNHGLSCLAATALGANAIEKHFTLNREHGGADNMVSMEPEEINELFNQIKETALLLGNGADVIAKGDEYRRKNLRRSLALARNLVAGEIIQENDLIMLRPPTGLSWDERDKIIGKRAKIDLPFRHLLQPHEVK
jgi:N,N'-diacetyllegionaminate synthase